MKVGGKRQLIIPPSLGYGSANYGPIPGNSILVFTVTAVSVK
jgi:FKBP-type peptidyl-prolyl cis-trans isomerase